MMSFRSLPIGEIIELLATFEPFWPLGGAVFITKTRFFEQISRNILLFLFFLYENTKLKPHINCLIIFMTLNKVLQMLRFMEKKILRCLFRPAIPVLIGILLKALQLYYY